MNTAARRALPVRAGITLIETLVTIAIIAILLALTLVGVQRVRATAARLECADRLRQLALASHHYHSLRHHMPEGCGYPLLKSEADLKSHCGVSWLTTLLPFVEQDSLWQQAWEAHVAAPNGDFDFHLPVQKQRVKTFRCPSDPRLIGVGPTSFGDLHWGLTNYQGVAGTGFTFNDGMFHRRHSVTLGQVTDGTSNTLLIGERPTGRDGEWSAWYANWGRQVCVNNVLLPVRVGDWFPGSASGCSTREAIYYRGDYDDGCHLNHFWSLHPGGANFAFADGSVHFLRYSADSVLPALATRAGGEVAVVPD